MFISLVLLVSGRSSTSRHNRQSTEVLLLTGGNSDSGMEAGVQVFPGSTGCSVPALDAPRRDHVTFLQGNTLISCGGTSTGLKTATDCVSLDMESGTWQHHSQLTSVYREYATFAVIDGLNCIVGGRIDAKKTIECLDPATNFWIELPETIPGSGVYSSCGVNLPDGGALFMGGVYDGFQILERSATGSWGTSWGKLPEKLTRHSCSLFAGGSKVMVAGGKNVFDYALGSTLIIDVASGEQVRGSMMTTPRELFALTTLDGLLVAVTGFNNDGKLDSAEAYNEETGQWELLDFKASPAVGNSGSVVVMTDFLKC